MSSTRPNIIQLIQYHQHHPGIKYLNPAKYIFRPLQNESRYFDFEGNNEWMPARLAVIDVKRAI